MTARRTATLFAALLIFSGGLFAGFQMLTSAVETAPPPPTCTPRAVEKGEDLTTNLVTVNAYNASRTSGLANRVTINLQRRGFLGGSIGNNESATKPRALAILTDDRNDPRVKLVAAQFLDKAKYAPLDIKVEGGVTIVIGEGYRGLKKKAPRAIKANQAVSVCVPLVQLP